MHIDRQYIIVYSSAAAPLSASSRDTILYVPSIYIHCLLLAPPFTLAAKNSSCACVASMEMEYGRHPWAFQLVNLIRWISDHGRHLTLNQLEEVIVSKGNVPRMCINIYVNYTNET